MTAETVTVHSPLLVDVGPSQLAESLLLAFDLEPSAATMLAGQLNKGNIILTNPVLEMTPYIGPPAQHMQRIVDQAHAGNFIAKRELAAIKNHHRTGRGWPMLRFFQQFPSNWEVELIRSLRPEVTRIEFRYESVGGGRLVDVLVQCTRNLYEQSLQQGFELFFHRVIEIAKVLRSIEDEIPRFTLDLPAFDGNNDVERQPALITRLGEVFPENEKIRTELVRAARPTLTQLAFEDTGAGDLVLTIKA